MKIVHEFNESGGHRLATRVRNGGWVGYREVAVLRIDHGWVAGVTEYYRDSNEFPDPSKLYTIAEYSPPLPTR